MSNRNYTPADWPGDNQWSRLQDSNNDDRYNDDNQPNYPNFVPNRPNEQTFNDQYGRRCRIVCEQSYPYPYPRPYPRPQDPRKIAYRLIGLTVAQAQRIYPNIRVVIRDGQTQVVTQDYRTDRINVETRNGIIVRIVGFY